IVKLRREIANLLHGSGVQLLQERDQKLDGLIEIAPVHDAVVRVGIANRNQQADRRNAAVALLNLCGVVSISRDQVELQRQLLRRCGGSHQFRQFSIRELRTVEQK